MVNRQAATHRRMTLVRIGATGGSRVLKGGQPLRLSRCIDRNVSTSSPFWFLMRYAARMMPRSGFELEGFLSITSSSVWSVSPGRTGLSQRSSSKPGEPMLATRKMPVSSTMRKPSARVWKPLAMSPP